MGKFVLPDDCTMFVKSGTTEFAVISDTGGLYHQGTILPDTSNIVTTTNAQTLEHKTLGIGVKAPIEILSWSSGGVSPSSMVAFGISRISMTGGDPSTSPATVSLAAPIAGVEKTIILETTAAYINTIDVNLSTNVGISGTSNQFIAFSTLATDWQTITLFGVTTAMWAVRSVNSTVGAWNAATGIRAVNAARTS